MSETGGEHAADERREYLANRDVLCTCGYNLRGLTGDRCPECGAAIRLPPPGPPPLSPGDAQRLRDFLRGRDLYCKHCKYNLRDLDTNTCPECGTTYYLVGGIGAPDTRPAPMEPAELAAGCLAVAALPGVVIFVFQLVLSPWGAPLPWQGRGRVLMPLLLLPLLLVVGVGFSRRWLNALPRRVRWMLAIALAAAGLVGMVAGLWLVM